jgi:hypothetical protein
MENLNGHEAGNGGYSQEDTYSNSPFLDPTLGGKGAEKPLTYPVIQKIFS